MMPLIYFSNKLLIIDTSLFRCRMTNILNQYEFVNQCTEANTGEFQVTLTPNGKIIFTSK